LARVKTDLFSLEKKHLFRGGMDMRYAPRFGMLTLVIGVSFASAREAITIGPTFTIAEPDTLEEIKQRAGFVDWKSWLMRTDPERAPAFQSVDLPHAAKDRSFLFDPTYTLPRDLVGRGGQVLWPKGTTVNVYERIRTTSRTIVIADDPDHFLWLRDVAKPQAGDRVFLAGGNVLVRMRAEQRRLYVLDARVVERFWLAAVPAIVRQEGNRLRVTEYALGG